MEQPAAAAAAKWLQSCPTLCDPIDGSPPGSPVPGILHQKPLTPGGVGSGWNLGAERETQVPRVTQRAAGLRLEPRSLDTQLESVRPAFVFWRLQVSAGFSDSACFLPLSPDRKSVV